MYFPKCPTCQHAASDVAAQPSARTAPEKKDEAGEGRQRCSLTLLMLITSIYCAHNMGAAPNQQLLPHLPTRNSAAPWTSFLLLFLLLRLRATHASLDTLWGRWWPPHYPTLLLWTLFPSYSYILRRGKFNYRMRIFLLVFISLRFFFLCSPRFRFEYFFCFSRKHPKTNFQRISIYLLLIYAANTPFHPPPPYSQPPWAARSVKQSTSTSTSPPRPHPHSRSDSDSDPERCWIFAKYADWIFSSWLNDIKDICQASATAFAPASRLRLLKPMSSMIFLAYRTLESADYI